MCSIRVICRLRPENKLEQSSGLSTCLTYADTTLQIKIQDRNDETHDFSFDRVCGPLVSQKEVFTYAAEPVVQGVLDGYNGTIFAYGQTGSGKTFTMEGPDITDQQSKGIIPRMMDALFEGLVNASESTEFTLRVSYLEIYLERIQDLLDSSKSNLQVKEDKLRGIYVQNATEVYVSSPLEMMKTMKAGSMNRSIAATRMNERSSRSHSIFCVNVEQKDMQGNKKSGRLYFVDLAGSESVGKTNVSGQQLKEAQMINKSLSALGNVINALTEKAGNFVPYRDSKLTRILQESLGGNSQTSLIIACSLSSFNDKETLSTLRFGQRAKRIQNKPVVNQERGSKELIKQIEHMQNELKRQAEIINRIHLHTKSNYSEHGGIVEDIEEIINGAFVSEKKTVKTHSEKQDSEYALTLLKQHIEVVRLIEELQCAKAEKKEIEDELAYRNKESIETELQLSEAQQILIQARKDFAVASDEMTQQIEKLTADSLSSSLKSSKALKVCERLKSDLQIIKNEIPKQEPWSEILSKSLDGAITFFATLSDLPSHPLSAIETFPIPESNVAESLRLSELQSQYNSLNEKFNKKCSEFNEISLLFERQTGLVEELKLECELLRRQLDTKVKNIEDERASNALEMKYKDLEIHDLKESLKAEREHVESLKRNTPQVQSNDTQDRIEELRSEREKLFEEIIKLRRELDLREEQLHSALQKNKRLERQSILVSQSKPAGSFSRAISPNSEDLTEFDSRFSKKISKPLRGGGGNYSNFQKNNQIIGFNNDLLIKRKSIEKISNQGSGFQNMIKDLFGGLLG